jgi:hypothetical protein
MIACELEDLFDEACPVCTEVNDRAFESWHARIAASPMTGPEPLVLHV